MRFINFKFSRSFKKSIQINEREFKQKNKSILMFSVIERYIRKYLRKMSTLLKSPDFVLFTFVYLT